jgi:hypothetical protein
MQNIGVVCDTTWDNYILINNKFKKINSEYYRLHALYGKTLEIFNNCAFNNNLLLIRNYSNKLSKTIYNLLKICDIWLIFSNQIEYNTQTRLVIDKCEEYNIKYIIISEYSREQDYYSFDIDKELSFKKILAKIIKLQSHNKINMFEEIEYDENYTRNVNTTLVLSNEIKSKIKDSYNEIYQNKKERCIQLLYDKQEFKKEKQIKKTIKEANILNLQQNRLNYYKNT